jgi:hypothetical protein
MAIENYVAPWLRVPKVGTMAYADKIINEAAKLGDEARARRVAPEPYEGPDLECHHCGADSTPFLTCRACAESGQ